MDDDLERLQQAVGELGSAVVAYSGGVDSALLLAVAHQVLGDQVVAVTAVSPSLPAAEKAAAEGLARHIGARHVLMETAETADPRYRENTPLRCYYCRTAVYGQMTAFARQNGFGVVLDGTNADDAAETRPGRQAAREHGVLSPLAEAGLTKADTRALARRLGLPNWDKPSAACLSSRVPYGTEITAGVLAQVEQSEAALRRLGIRQLRVRHHGSVARIEVEEGDIPVVMAHRQDIAAALEVAGYSYVSLDLVGFRSGSLNEALRTTTAPSPD